MWLAYVGVLAAGPAPASAEEQPLPCRPYLIYCNYADHFAGTIHLKSVLQVENDPEAGSSMDITVTVAAGKATCAGTIDGKPIRGAGLLAVERGGSMEDAPGQPWYDITVACPDADGAAPRFSDASIKTYKQKDTADFRTLAGKVEEDNADADPANGVTGTTTLEWSLSRKGTARP